MRLLLLAVTLIREIRKRRFRHVGHRRSVVGYSRHAHRRSREQFSVRSHLDKEGQYRLDDVELSCENVKQRIAI